VKKPMVKDGIFRIMSMTKPVIGVAILLMMEEGKVRLQDPVSKFVPEWKSMTVAVPQPAPPSARGGGPAPTGRTGGPPPEPRYYTIPVEREVTVRDLLTHTSGVVSGDQFANRAVAAGPRRRSPTTFRDSERCLWVSTGTRWAYSAAALDVLSRIVEVAQGCRSIDSSNAYLRSARDETRAHRPQWQPASR
jgi:CubicO group peptidase (beta-lactamase class C family)